jgi:hypothetical protein
LLIRVCLALWGEGLPVGKGRVTLAVNGA